MRRAEALWLKIIGVLLILLGLVLIASPRITYRTREKVIHTESMDITAKRQKTVVVPRIGGALVLAAGVTVFVLASRRTQP